MILLILLQSAFFSDYEIIQTLCSIYRNSLHSIRQAYSEKCK